METVALLRADVRQLLAAQAAHEIAVERATAILCAEIAAEHIVAYGRPGVWRERRFTSGLSEPIPSVFFAEPGNTIQSDGWATCGWDMSVQDWADWNGPDWGNVRFKRDDAFKLFGKPISGGEVIEGASDDLLTTQSNSKSVTADARLVGAPTERGRLAIPNKPGAGGKKAAAASAAMVQAVKEGRVTFDALRRMKQKELAGLYSGAGRTTLTESREAALADLRQAGYSDKAPA